MKTVVKTILIFVFSFLLIFSAWKIFDIQRGYKAGENTYENLQQYVTVSASTISSAPEHSENEPNPAEAGTIDINWPQVDFEQLKQINPDVVGWIYIEGTSINYPVVQGDDDSYYLTHLFDGSYNSSGSIFLSSSVSSDFSDRHSIIFGHNMKNDTMFADLMDYKDPVFFEEHPSFLLLTPDCNYLIQIFSGYVADSDVNSWECHFVDIPFDRWISDVTKKSVFASEHQPRSDDLIVSLSTCSYEFSDARFLTHGYIAHRESVMPAAD